MDDKHNAQRNVRSYHEAAKFDDVLQIRPGNHFGHQGQYAVRGQLHHQTNQLHHPALQGIDGRQHALAFFHILFQQLKRCHAEECRENDDTDDGGRVSPGQVSKRVLRHKGKDQLRYAEIGHFSHIVALDGVQTGCFCAALNQTLGGEAEHIGHQHANQSSDKRGEQQSADAQEADFSQLRGIMQPGHRAQDRGEDQRHHNHLQQLDIAITDDIEPLDGILQHLAVRPVDQLQRQTKDHTNGQTNQHFPGQAPLFMASLPQRKQ
ncbi:Uncharacterised protein [Klebsiella variicola]|nr:Uncharacterised protein [Klebsiella variicola]